jgi:ABC-2 type transport system ATP-binding protein
MVRPECPTSQPSVSPLIELRDLCKSFGESLAVDHIAFTLQRERIPALLGENGAGNNPTTVQYCSMANLLIIVVMVSLRSFTKTMD